MGAGFDLHGAVAAGGGDELLDRPAGTFLDDAGDREGGEHDAQVGFDGVTGVVEDRPGGQVALGHAEALLDPPQLVVGADHEFRCRGIDVGGVGLPAGQRARLGFEFTVDAFVLSQDIHTVLRPWMIPSDLEFAAIEYAELPVNRGELRTLRSEEPCSGLRGASI